MEQKQNLANLISYVDRLDIDKFKNLPNGLSSLKSKVDKLDVDKLLPVLVDLSKLSDAVKIDFVKRNAYNAKIKNTEDKIPYITNFGAKTTLNVKIYEVKGEIPSITILDTATTLAVVENKILNVCALLKKKTDYNANINETERKINDQVNDKYITTSEFNKLAAESFAAKLVQANLSCKNDIAYFVHKTDFDGKLKNLNKKDISNKTKHLLVKNELKKTTKSFIG